jgi:hypothetical protein
VEISYPAEVAQQYLAYGSMYDKSLMPISKSIKVAELGALSAEINRGNEQRHPDPKLR